MMNDEPRSPNAEPAQAPLRRSARRSRRGDGLAGPPEPETPRVEDGRVPRPALDQHRARRGAIERAWLEEHHDFHPLDIEDVFSRNQRPKIDEYDDYLFIVLHFPRFDKQVGRLNAAEVDIFIGPDFLITIPNEPAQPLEYLFERCRQREDVREQLFSKGPGYLLYKIVDDCVDAELPDAAQDRQQARAHRGRHLRGQVRRDRARHLQREAGDHQLPQDRPPAARGVRRPRAHEVALHRRRARHLLRRHQRRLGAHLADARGLQGDGRGARDDERVGARPPAQRHPPRADRVQRRSSCR